MEENEGFDNLTVLSLAEWSWMINRHNFLKEQLTGFFILNKELRYIYKFIFGMLIEKCDPVTSVALVICSISWFIQPVLIAMLACIEIGSILYFLRMLNCTGVSRPINKLIGLLQ